jgi:hypothetical protein
MNVTTYLCQNSCGDYYAENITIGRCIRCTNYRCLKCSISNYYNCTLCAASAFRTLNATAFSCNCNSGYFDNGYSEVCRACDSFVIGANTCYYPFSSNTTF